MVHSPIKSHQAVDPYQGSFALDDGSETLEEGEEQVDIADASMDSSLPSVVNPRYQTYPAPPSGARSLIGGFVSLDGESVEIPIINQVPQQRRRRQHRSSGHTSESEDASSSEENDSAHDRAEDAVILGSDDGDGAAGSSRRPPSVVDVGHALSTLSDTLCDGIRSFRILGKDNLTINNRPTLPANTASSPLPRPPSILRNPLPDNHKNHNSSNHSKPAVTPTTVVSLASSAFLHDSPLREIAFGGKTTRKTDAEAPEDDDAELTTLASRSDCVTRWCCPYWIQRSPPWLKLFLLVSALLFLSATCLVGVAVAFAVRDGTNGERNDSQITPPPVTTTTTTVPPPPQASSTLPTTSAAAATDDVTSTTVTASATTANITTETAATEEQDESLPTLMPTFAPTSTPTAAPAPLTFAPTAELSRDVMEFFVAAGTWDHHDVVDPSVVLPRLPVRRRRAFVVHLGDWNDDGGNDTVTDCGSDRYRAVRDLWSTSAPPVYFVAGAAETIRCPSPDDALENWREDLLRYHRAFWPRPPWTFWDDNFGGFPDAWVFDSHRTAVLGLHLTAGGAVDDRVDDATLEWIDINYDFYRRDRDVMVLLANARVDDPAHAAFFSTLFRRVDDDYRAVNFVWVQPSSPVQDEGDGDGETPSPGEGPSYRQDYQGRSNFDVITVQRNVWPPMRIRIDGDANISIEQDEWFDEHTGLST